MVTAEGGKNVAVASGELITIAEAAALLSISLGRMRHCTRPAGLRRIRLPGTDRRRVYLLRSEVEMLRYKEPTGRRRGQAGRPPKVNTALLRERGLRIGSS